MSGTKMDNWRRAYSGPLNGEMGKEDPLGTLPLFLSCRHLGGLQFPLAEVWDGINYNPRYAPTEVDGLHTRQGQSFVRKV